MWPPFTEMASECSWLRFFMQSRSWLKKQAARKGPLPQWKTSSLSMLPGAERSGGTWSKPVTTAFLHPQSVSLLVLPRACSSFLCRMSSLWQKQSWCFSRGATALWKSSFPDQCAVRIVSFALQTYSYMVWSPPWSILQYTGVNGAWSVLIDISFYATYANAGLWYHYILLPIHHKK